MTGPVLLPTIYADEVEFFDLRIADTFMRYDQLPWCSEWQKHPEAVEVMKALWNSWEGAQRMPPDGPGVWLRDYLYPLLFDRLTDPNGTFKGCSWREDDPRHDPQGIPLTRT